MKKSRVITLVLVTGLLAACKSQPRHTGPRLYLRSDSTAPYTGTHHYYGHYFAFRPFGRYFGGSYHRSGYYSGAISSRSNPKSSISRGGFGKSGYSVGSSRT